MPAYDQSAYLAALSVDKKQRDSRIRFVVLEGLGRARTVPLRPREIAAALPRRAVRKRRAAEGAARSGGQEGVTDSDRLEAWLSAVERDPGAAVFPALAEALRRQGRLEQAEEVVTEGLLADPESLAGRCVLLLILDDCGRREQLRGRLEAWADEAVMESGGAPEAQPDPPAQPGLERGATSSAPSRRHSPELESMITPDSVAEEAALQVDGDYATHAPLEENPHFATPGPWPSSWSARATRRGPRGSGRSWRRPRAHPRPRWRPAAEDPGEGPVLATLERWLANARRLQT